MRDRMQKAKLRVHLGLYDDETSQVCQWHLPEAHFLETWGDARAFDGTVTIQQPLIQPLYGGRSAYELLQSLTDQPEKTPYDIVKSYWNGAAYRRRFRSLVAARGARRRGARHGAARKDVTVRGEALSARAGASEARRQAGSDLPSRPHDLRRPLRQQRLAAGIAQADHQAHLGQRRLHQPGDGAPAGRADRRHAEVDLRRPHAGRAGLDPAGPCERRRHAAPGLRPHAAGRAGTGMGFNPYGLRTAKALWQDVGLDAKKTGGSYEFATTQNVSRSWRLLDRRHIIHRGDLADYRKNPESVHEGAEAPPQGAHALSRVEIREAMPGAWRSI